MSLLGFDTSTPATSVCVLRADGELFETRPDAAALTRPPAHASELMPAVAELLRQARVGYEDLEAIAVGVGPGTFTGLRIGVATARGLALAHGLELRPVSSLAALAAGLAETLGPARESLSLLPLIDAKRGELYGALYEGARERWPAFVASPAALVERLRREDVAPVAAGDGSVRFREVLEAAGVRVEPDRSPAHVVRALHICRLAAALAGVAPEAVLPEYLRVPDAKPQ
ncbi:MAG TPA: tRNA (adenosine(37)-N6)-threonylcarbamoyltransferase complex dimerization subunit type 1 TsaB [Thermoleophilaceae bacterium]